MPGFLWEENWFMVTDVSCSKNPTACAIARWYLSALGSFLGSLKNIFSFCFSFIFSRLFTFFWNSVVERKPCWMMAEKQLQIKRRRGLGDKVRVETEVMAISVLQPHPNRSPCNSLLVHWKRNVYLIQIWTKGSVTFGVDCAPEFCALEALSGCGNAEMVGPICDGHPGR